MSKFIFNGAQGTGKSTILKELESKGYEVVTEVVRNLSKKGVKINKDGDEKGQKKIFNEYLNIFNSKDNYVSDRGLIDVVAYTVYLVRHGKISEKFADKQLKELHKFTQSNPDVVYFYFPVEFDIEDDGVRDLDKDFQKEINEIILTLYASLGIRFVTLSGTVEERLDKIKRLENWFEEASNLFSQIN